MYAGVLFIIFGVCSLLVGLFMFSGSGHPINAISWRVPFRNLKKSEWKNIGKWTMITSLFIIAIGIAFIIFHLD